MSGSESKAIPVRVALRIRPLVGREISSGSQSCLEVVPGEPQLVVKGTARAFTYDYAFGPEASQDQVYHVAVSGLVETLFKGYNVTVLAYGQTGSGKTFTMGTAYDSKDGSYVKGIIPRALQDIFEQVDSKSDWEFSLKVSFVEPICGSVCRHVRTLVEPISNTSCRNQFDMLYKEQLYDLLSNKSREECIVDLREDSKGAIRIAGLTEIPVKNFDDTMTNLERGSSRRATGATAMNSTSSRSHAIFTLCIDQWKKGERSSMSSAKFHMVDLAGSERSKKTLAEGTRFQEGVNINRGLLALGNVITGLCEGSQRSHIPYRDSRLTRLLQDSLGGNSHTVMIACVSPADTNLEESLSTLNYSNRVRQIKNKPVVNRDPQAAELARLKQEVHMLQMQVNQNPQTITKEREELLQANKDLREKNRLLTAALRDSIQKSTELMDKVMAAEQSQEKMHEQMEILKAQAKKTVVVMNETYNCSGNQSTQQQLDLVQELETKINELAEEQHKAEKKMRRSTLPMEIEVIREAEEECDEEEEEEGDGAAMLALKQAELNQQLLSLNQALAEKEELVSRVAQSTDQLGLAEGPYSQALKELEEQVETLAKEKEDLLQALRTAQTGNASSKLSEQRRKRVQELEKQIAEFKRKILEQSKIIKLKEKSEEKIKKLNGEIQSMKQKRVQLIRQLREEGERFRQEKQAKEREMVHLRQKERRHEFQLARMEQAHEKQQNVLRRRMEEAMAVNRRLKDALAVQRTVQETRRKNAGEKPALEGMAQRVGTWVSNELEVAVSAREACRTLRDMMEDRGAMSTEMSKHQTQLKEPGINSASKAKLQEKLLILESQISEQNAQIADLQNKLVETDQETKEKARWDSIQSMLEAKCALKFLFTQATSLKSEATTKAKEIDENALLREELQEKIKELKKENEILKRNHEQEVTLIERENEEKVLYLLEQLPVLSTTAVAAEGTTQDEDVQKRLRFQEEELRRCRRIHESLQTECDNYKHQLLQSRIRKADSEENIHSDVKVEKKPKAAKSQKKQPLLLKEILDTSSEREMDDVEKDPDWTKTPIYQKYKKTQDPSGTTVGVKRDSNGIPRCGCRGECRTRACRCQKAKKPCGENCECKPKVCQNRSARGDDEVTINSNDSDSDFSLPLPPSITVKRARFLNSSDTSY